MKTLWLSIALCAALTALPALAADKAAAAEKAGETTLAAHAIATHELDGKTFVVQMKTPFGKVVEDKYTITDGKIVSAAAQSLGFSPAKILVNKLNGSYTLTATMKDAKGDVRRIHAIVTGDRMVGRFDVPENGKTVTVKFMPKTGLTKAKKVAKNT